MSYIYIRSESELWTVGHYDPSGQFRPESDHDRKEDAAARVHYLNGGRPEPVLVDTDGFTLRDEDGNIVGMDEPSAVGPTESHDVGGEPWRRDQT